MNKKNKLNRSEIMSRVHSKETRSELILRKALWSKGYRYRKNTTYIYGKPDIAFIAKKIAIFCDSEFWHGKYYLDNKRIPSTNREYWIAKFQKNIARDIDVNEKLTAQGWTILRFWEQDILTNTNSIVDSIIECFQKKSKSYND